MGDVIETFTTPRHRLAPCRNTSKNDKVITNQVSQSVEFNVRETISLCYVQVTGNKEKVTFLDIKRSFFQSELRFLASHSDFSAERVRVRLGH